MIDQIFDENFDDLDKLFKDAIIELFNRGEVVEAYEIWRRANGLM